MINIFRYHISVHQTYSRSRQSFVMFVNINHSLISAQELQLPFDLNHVKVFLSDWNHSNRVMIKDFRFLQKSDLVVRFRQKPNYSRVRLAI